MRIELEGTTFCVTGNFDNHQNTRTVEAALRAGGGKTMKSFGQKVQALVFGSGYTQKTQTARDRGLPIIREAELDRLLADGFVEIAFEPPSVEGGESTLDELLGEVRGVLDGAPSPILWDRLIGLVNQCDPDQVGPLVDYVDSHLEHWPAHHQTFCVAQKEWVAAMIQGQDTPAYRLVRRLDLGEVDVNTTGFKKILGCASLDAVRSMDIAVDKKLTKAAFKTLAKHPLFTQLDELVVGFFDEGSARELDVPANLTSLGCYPDVYWRFDADTYDHLFEATACAGVRRLTFYTRTGWGSGVAGVLARLADDANLPAFDHLEIDFVRHGSSLGMHPMSADTLAWTVDRTPEAARARVQTLTLRTKANGYFFSEDTFDMTPLMNLRTIRLFDAGVRRDPKVGVEDFDRVFHADKLALPESLERVVTNAPLDRGAFARLIEARPDLEVVQGLNEYPFEG